MFYQKLTIALVGRPNVGKSTLFNRLISARHAIVEDTPGVTRDYREGEVIFGELKFRVLDTAGLEDSDNILSQKMTANSLAILSNADLIAFVIDAQSGLTNADLEFAKLIRKSNKPVITIVNKAESRNVRDNIKDAYKLGFDEVIGVSAAHGDGMIDFYEYIIQFHGKWLESQNLEDIADEDNEQKANLQIAIVGRPNAGKSTLINSLLGFERVLTGPEPGITRDAIAIDWQYKEQTIKLIDTAGMRRKSQVIEQLEKMSFSDAERAIQYAQIVIILMDVNNALEKQDLAIIEHAIKEGRGIVLGFNKADQIKNKKELFEELELQVGEKISIIKKVPIVFLSALKNKNVYEVIEESLKVYKQWKYRISTAKLNEWLSFATSHHPLPLSPTGNRVKIKYATQHKTRPPSFLLFTTKPDLIDQTYLRYLTKSLAEYFDLNATPIRLILRKQQNPYAN